MNEKDSEINNPNNRRQPGIPADERPVEVINGKFINHIHRVHRIAINLLVIMMQYRSTSDVGDFSALSHRLGYRIHEYRELHLLIERFCQFY